MDNTFNIVEVAEGVRLCSYKTSRFKTGRLSFNIALPLAKDASANAILPYILNRSCEKFPNYIELNKKLSALYGATLTPSVSKAGEAHILRLSMTMIDNKFALENDEDIILSCVDLLLDIVFAPNAKDGAFCESEVTREKRLMLERLESEMNDKRVYALRRLEQIMCENEAFSSNAYGTKEGIETLTPGSIYEAYQHAIETGLISVHVVGNTDTDEIANKLRDRIANINRVPVTNIETEVIEKASYVRKEEEVLPVNQGKLVMGFRTGETDTEAEYPYIRIMTDIFGGGTYSRLFTNVREKMSLCYYCSARLYRQKGIIIVQSGIENENAETAITEILNQLKSLADGNVCEDDIKASLLSMKDLYNSVCDTPEDIDAWAHSQITEKTFETPEEVIARLEKVTIDDVVATAKKVSLDTIYLLKADETNEEGAE